MAGSPVQPVYAFLHHLLHYPLNLALVKQITVSNELKKFCYYTIKEMCGGNWLVIVIVMATIHDEMVRQINVGKQRHLCSSSYRTGSTYERE